MYIHAYIYILISYSYICNSLVYRCEVAKVKCEPDFSRITENVLLF